MKDLKKEKRFVKRFWKLFADMKSTEIRIKENKRLRELQRDKDIQKLLKFERERTLEEGFDRGWDSGWETGRKSYSVKWGKEYKYLKKLSKLAEKKDE